MADADTHGHQRKFATLAIELPRRRHGDPRAAHTQRMSEGDCAAIWIHVRGVFRNAKLAQHSNALAGKRFIQLDDIHLIGAQAGKGERLLRSGSGAHTHNAGLNACCRHAYDASNRIEVLSFDRFF